jgi:FtsP/CotA-like multicopper oxidase with cupredoxin domain
MSTAIVSCKMRCAAATVAGLACVGSGFAAQSPQVPLAGSAIPQFIQPLPTLSIAPQNSTIRTVFGNKALTIRMCEFKANVLPPGAVPNYAGTWVWGYIVGETCPDPSAPLDTYVGPVIVNQRGGASTDVTWVNDLGDTASTHVLAYKYSTDQTIHWADPLAEQVDGKSNICMMKVATCSFTDPATGMSTQCYPNPGDDCAQNYDGPIPAAPHLHGGEQPAEVDGGPDTWWTSDGLYRGHKYYSFPGALANAALYKYPNTQEAAPLWFHDHTLGATRLNVYMGLAGANFIEDPDQDLPSNLQPLTEVIPLVLQDRMFDTDGQLFFPADSAGGVLSALNPEHPYWVPEFVGDTIVINGKAWPYLNVDPRRYRFLFLNGSNARTYEMFLTDPVTKVNGPPVWVISTDGGYLDAPVKIDPNAAKPAQTKLVMQPGERYGVIIDFNDPTWRALNPNLSGTLILKNTGRTPYPKGEPPMGSTLGQMMQFRVSATPVTDTSYDPASGMPLRTVDQQIVRLVNPTTGALADAVTPTKTRALTLNEVELAEPVTAIDPVTGETVIYPGGPFEILVNNTKWAGKEPNGPERGDFTYITVNGTTTGYSEMPVEGDTEVWEIINTTADAHPIHLHLVQFQLLNRQNYNTNKYEKAYGAAFGTDETLPPLPDGCTTGMYCPAYGPPLNYNPSAASGYKYGGNPDVTPYLQGPIKPPAPNEAGWKDTIITYPGTVTRLAVRWAPNSLPVNTPPKDLYFPFDVSGDGYQSNYVFHCHIIDHEDNEMMRPDVVQLNPSAPEPSARPLVRGVGY